MVNLKISLLFGIMVLGLMSGCKQGSATLAIVNETQQPSQTPRPITATPFRVATKTAAPPSVMPDSEIRIYFDSAVPATLENQISFPAGIRIVAHQEDANLIFGPVDLSDSSTLWIYALVTPFSSLIEQISLSDLRAIWTGQVDSTQILVNNNTRAALDPILGISDSKNVRVIHSSDLLAHAWAERDVLAIVPFETLEPRWKVVSIDGKSPISNKFDLNNYPLGLAYGWEGDLRALGRMKIAMNNGLAPPPTTNRDPNKLSVMVMTGVTALVRATATRMEEMGMTYPGEAIRDWLIEADLTHISNEVSFSPDCPDPQMSQPSLFFCSKPEYIELLDNIDTDIIELTGNHGVDWGRESLLFSLDLYRQRGWAYYAAGEDLNRAREAITVEHNGNKFAFMGCNPAGPEFIWATETQAGVANCDYPWIWERIRALSQDGYNVIFTFQYFETYRHWVLPFEEQDFRSMAEAGAVIVSGSQAHHPMVMEFYRESFIHYGLGNLFFDQMWVDTVTIPQGTRKEFIDRHVFYDGQHISTELLTAFLEDYSQPRPMSSVEREEFLKEIFSTAGWGPY